MKKLLPFLFCVALLSRTYQADRFSEADRWMVAKGRAILPDEVTGIRLWEPGGLWVYFEQDGEKFVLHPGARPPHTVRLLEIKKTGD